MRLSPYIFFLGFFLVLFVGRPACATEKTETVPFGHAQFLTCVEGIQHQHLLYAGLEITPDENWQIKKVRVDWSASDGSLAKTFLPLFPQEDDSFVYPTIYRLAQNKKQTTYTANAIVQACAGTECHDYPITLQKTIEPAFAFHSPECIRILNAFARTPQPFPNDVQGWAKRTESSTHVSLHLPHETTRVDFFDTNYRPFLVQNLKINRKNMSFDLPQTSDPLLHFFIGTPLGNYQIQLPILDQNDPIPKDTIPIATWVSLFMLFFITSPLLMVWGCHWQRTLKDFQLFCQYIRLIILAAIIIGIALAWMPEVWQQLPFNKTLSCILMYATFVWGRSSPILCLFAILFMPKPGWDIMQQASPYARILFIALAGLGWSLLFKLQSDNAKSIYGFLKKWRKESPRGIRFVFSLFWILLAIYMLIYL